MAGSIGTDPYGLRSALKKPTEDDNVSGDDPFGLRSALKKKENSKYALPTGADYSENGGVAGQTSQDTNPTGFREVKPSKVISVQNKPIDDTNDDAEVERMQKQQADAQAQYDREHPDTGSWSNTLPTLFHATLGVVTKGVAGVGNIARDIAGEIQPSDRTGGNDSSQPLYKTDPWGQSTGELTDYGKQVDAKKNNDLLGRLVIGLDAYNNETAKTDYVNHLPKTLLGNTATGLINIAPIAATASLFPEAEVAEGGAAAETSLNVASLQKLKDIAVNPFTKVSAIQGGLTAYDEAKQRGETPGQAVVSGLEGTLQEGGQAAVYNMLGEFGANFVSPKIAKGLTENGILKDGKLTRIGTDATADAIVFSAYPIASNLIQGKPVNWDEVEQGLGTGLAFGGMKGLHTNADFSEADDQLKQTGDAVAMKNFYDAAPEAIHEAYQLPTSIVDLNAKAVDYAAKAKAETNLPERQQLIAASSMYQKLADVKTITQAVLGNPTDFISNINADESLTPEQKSGLISKITSVPEIIKGTTKADPILNFTTAGPEDLVSAMQRPESAQELQSLAFAKKMEMQQATDPAQQAQLDAEHQQLQQHADIKAIGETVINHGIDPFTEAVNGSDLPDDLKSTLISKAHGINQEFNPVVQKEAENKATVEDLTNKIDTLQNTPGATDPVNNPTGVANLIDLVEQRTDKQVELLDKAIDNPEHLPNRPILYHGSADDFDNFSPEHLGLFTNSESAKNGFFFTNSEDVANTYKNAGVINRPNIEGLKEHLESLSEKELESLYKSTLGKYTGNVFDPEDPKDAINQIFDAAKEDHGEHIYDKKFITDQIAKHESNNNRGYKAYETKGTLHQVHLDEKNPLIVDGNGEHPGGLDINNIIKEAKEKGYDSVIIKNIHDEAAINEKGAQYEPSDIHIVFHPDQIKKLNANEQEKETETGTAALPGTGVPANTDSNGVLEGGFQFKSKDHGILNIVPEEKGEYTVHFGDGTSFKGTPEDIKLAVPDFDESKIGAPEDVQTLHGTDNPNEIARIYDDKVRELKDTGSIEGAIADYNPSTDKETFGRVDDPNNLTKQIARNYFRDKGERPIGLDLQADEINRLYFNGAEKVTPQDIADFMKKYPSGARSYSTAKGNPELAEIAQRYTDLTGKPLTNAVARDLAAKYNNVSAKEIRDTQEHFDTPENTDKIKRFIDNELSKPGLHDMDTVIAGMEREFDRYLSDPNNEFNPFFELFGGDMPAEEDIKKVRDEIEQTKTEQLPGDTGVQEPANPDSGAAPVGEEGAGGEGERKPTEVEQAYDQQISDKKDEVKSFEKQVENKLAELSKKNDLFESTGTKKGEEAQQDIFDKTATNTEPDNIKQILEPIRAKLETAKRELAELEGNRDAVFEQARKQYQMELDDIPFQRGAGEIIPPERAEKIQGLMKKVFPNVETIFHPTVADFAEAAKANGIDSLPNAFIDKSGTIHFNPESLHADTQIHEYGHILTQWAKENAPTLYNRMIAFGRDAKDIHQELKNNGYNLTGNRLHEEAFVTMLGRHGEGKLEEVIKNSGTRGTVSKFINDLWTRFQRYIADKTGFDLARFKNIKDMPINEFLDHVNSKYLLSDTKISDIGTKEYSDVEQQKPQKPMREDGESMADYFKRVIDWTKEQQKPAEELKDPEGAQFTLEEDKLKPGYNYSETSIKNRVVAEERRARFLDEVDVTAKRDFGDVWQRAKEIVDNDKNNPANTTGNQKYLPVQLAEDIIKKPRPLTAEETGILLYGRMQLYNDHRATMDNISDAVESGNAAMEAQERVRLSIIENNIENNDIAAKRAGYEQGLGLAARRMIAAQDYSLANQLQLAKIANGGKELPADVRMKLETLTKQLEDAQRKLADYQTNAAAKAAAVSLARLKKEAEAEQRAERNQKRSQSQDQIKKNIENIKSSILDKLRKNKGTTSTILPYADKLVEITPDLAKLAKEYIKSGIVSIEGIVDAVHDFIKDDLEGITKRDVRDALSGYGKTSKPSKETIEAQLRELRSQMRLTSALEDAENGERPLKTGYIHDEPSEKVRELQRQVHDAMRRNGINIEDKTISDEDAWKSALDSVKTRLRNQIDDLNKQIETGIKPEAKGRVIYDQEANDLKAERDRLKEAIDQTEGNKELTDEQRVEILTKTTEKSIDEYKERIDELKNTDKDSIGDERRAKQDALKNLIESTPDLKIARERLKALQDEHAKILDDAKPKRTDEEIKLDAFKKRKVKEIAELEKLLEKGKTDPSVFGKVPEKPSLILDDYSKHLQSESNGLKRKIDAERQKLKIKNMPWLSKKFFKGSKFVRFALLSRPTTLFKLGAAAAMRITLSPLEEVVGGGLSLIPGLNKVSAKAPREGGGFNFEAESKALATVFSKKTYQEAWRTAKQGKSELDDRMDDAGQKAFNEDGILAIPGHIHAAEKTIPKINEYNRSLHKRIDFALRNGYDITNPDTQTSIQINAFKENNPDLFYTKLTDFKDIDKKAYDDAKRAIFQQPNYISEAWNMALKNMEAKGPKAELYASMLRIFLPITKVPTNYAAEGLSYALGGFKAGALLFKGIDKLTPDQADMVMRLFKKQGIGAAFFGLGWLLKNYIGGYYNPNDSQEKKRKSDSPGPDEIKIYDTTMPHWLLHAPLLETMQMGATAGRIHDNYHHNNKESTLDEVGQNAFVSGKGLLEKVPFVSGPSDLNRGTENTSTTTKYISNFILSRVNVLGVLDIAQALDTDSHGKPIKRKTSGFGDEIMSHIPGEREELPKKK